MASFELSKYEVTFEEYDRFIAATGSKKSGRSRLGRGRRPVIDVSWEDAVAYAEWLSGADGGALPAADRGRVGVCGPGGVGEQVHFGNDASQLCRYGNHADTSTDFDWRNTACSDGVGKRTATVGSYQPNAFELHDVHGNVGEWVQDCWNDVIRVRRRMARPGPAATVRSACCAAAPGSSYLDTSAPRTASGSLPAFGTTSSVSVWPGRSPLESLTLYLGGPRGLAPWCPFCSA